MPTGTGLRLKPGKLYFTPFNDITVYPNNHFSMLKRFYLKPYEPFMVTDAKYPTNPIETWNEYIFLIGIKTYHKLVFNGDLYKFVEVI